MKAGEVANGLKFDKQLKEVKRAYGKKGYLEVDFNPQPKFDDANQRAVFAIAVSEGPQYRLGTIDFVGFSRADTEVLREKWELKPGEIYDESYSDRFIRERAASVMARIFKERQALQLPAPRIDTSGKADRKTLTVNLVIELKK